MSVFYEKIRKNYIKLNDFLKNVKYTLQEVNDFWCLKNRLNCLINSS